MPSSSIVIPVHNHASVTRQCLEGLLSDPATANCEIVVVDDGSKDETPQVLAEYEGRIQIVTSDENGGFARACNSGAAATSGDYIVFLNNDTIAQPGWLAALNKFADSTPKAAVVGSKLLFPNDTVQHAGVVITQERLPRHIYAGFPADHPAVNKSRAFQIVSAACALMRRGPFEELGGFDDAFLNGFEDVDLCLRLRERGYEVHYCHESVLHHLETVTRREGLEASDHNSRLYRERWADRVSPDDLRYYVEDGLLQPTYWDQFPIRLAVSPLLAVLEQDDHVFEADRLVSIRSRQVFELLKENIVLKLALEERRDVVETTYAAPTGQASGEETASLKAELEALRRAHEVRGRRLVAERVAFADSLAQVQAAVYGSRSWRYTAFLRRLTNALKRG